MLAQPFYETFYHKETLFRLADESWEVVVQPADISALIDVPVLNEPDLLAQLDTLLVESVATEIAVQETTPAEVLPVVEVMTISVPALTEHIELTTASEQISSQPDPVAPMPEPLPHSVPRPKTPSVIPPVQQKSRLPQLNHKVLLLADEELDPSNLIFLEKILNAVNLNVDGVDLLNLHGVQDVDFAELVRGKYINHFITFGVPFERINLDIMMDRYAPVRFDGITFLMTDSLPTIEADVNLKKRLWNSLQRVFLRW